MIGMEEFPLETALGKELGKMIANEHLQGGVKLHMKSGVKEITKDQNGNINGVVLTDGTVLNVDMAIVGTGIIPNTKFLERHDSGIKVDEQGAIVCDPFL
jgi:NAD(P)H-nitrite reductase large subunit